jgi:DNA-directed RNA polymerase alpha subunit
MVETSKNLSLKDLLAAFAVEQETEVLTLNHLKSLAGRIESLMANVRALNAFASNPITNDSVLCGHMEAHLIAVNNLIAQRDGDAMYAGIPDDQFV